MTEKPKARRRVPRNLTYRTVGADAKLATQRDSLVSLFSWAEELTQLTIDWYLWRKTSRGRWSKLCRGAAILLGILGGITPVLHAAYPAAPTPEWGFVLLGSAGGFVLADRIFGFSSSWTRFMRTQASLQADLAAAQARFLSWQARAETAEVVDAARPGTDRHGPSPNRQDNHRGLPGNRVVGRRLGRADRAG